MKQLQTTARTLFNQSAWAYDPGEADAREMLLILWLARRILQWHGVLALLNWGLGNRLSVAVGLKLGEIQPLQKIGIKNLGAVKVASGGGGGKPGNVAALTVLGSWNQE